ncbi:Small-conductance mechanosensitive channel [bioreactor metagenome]|jgi:small conductance mechanosensitive channel|uniref:Small-conductance mechanosensitive channel n=1 Tax=bioreactor metagenome TaxID=1076179 RepID=A0A644VY65_9ZZZZ|nr:mechanosensitive ion channel family protein [Paludibacter sp.]
MKEKLLSWSEAIIPWLLSHGIRIVLIAVIAYVLKRIIHGVIVRAVRIAVRSEDYQSKEAEEKRENTLISLFTVTLQTLIVLIAGMMILEELGVQIGPMLAAAGIVGLAFGFGGQYLIRDIITGLFVIMENQYRIGDVVNINGIGGSVENITLRKTTLRDLNGTVHHIPHGEIKTVSNLTKDFSRVNMNLGISYNSNLEHVIAVVNKIGNQMADDPQFKDSILKPIQFVRVDDFADSAIIIKMVGETKVLKQWEVAGEFRKRLKITFDKEGIEIPFPQRVVHIAQDDDKTRLIGELKSKN